MTDVIATPQPFTGFGPNATTWFTGLAADNTKDYFQRTRATFETEIRDPLEALLQEATSEFGGSVKIFRQNRDIRFSKDKSPYKTTTYGLIMRPGSAAALYAAISAAGLYAGTGYYELAPDQLERFRNAVAADGSGAELTAVMSDLETAGLEIGGESLKTVPRGYPKEHPRAELLRMKQLIAGATLPPGPALTDRRACDHAIGVWRTLAPLNAWLDARVGMSNAGAGPNLHAGMG